MAGRKGAISKAAGSDASWGTTAIPSGYKRLTVDIDAHVRADLDVWAANARAKHRANVSIAPAVRVMLGMLLDDEDLQTRVIDAIKAGEGAR